MLDASNRLRAAADFRHAVRRGRRAGGRLLVVHLVTTNVDKSTSGPTPPDPVRVGFVVAKSVGRAVTRNLVRRRLRHLVRDRLDRMPAGGLVVVRALPESGSASYDELGDELDRCLSRLVAS